MNNLFQPNYQFLSSGEKSILYTISLLPPRLYTAKYIYGVFNLKSNSDEGVRFFDTLHGLTRKGWLNFSKGAYQLTEVKKRLLYSFRRPDQHYFRTLAEKVTNFFSRDNNIDKASAEEVENQEAVATNILNNILRPTKQVAVLARNLSNYYQRKKAILLAIKYSKIAVDMQEQVDEYDDDLCCCLSERASMLNTSKKYQEAITTALECLSHCDSNYDNHKQYVSKQLCYAVLATAYEKTGNNEASMRYALLGLELGRCHKIAATLQHWMSYYNAGISYFRNHDYAKAWFHLVKAYAEYCDENNAKPRFFSKLTFRRNWYEICYRLTKVLK